MAKLTFGQNQSISSKVAKASAKGYDSGNPSKGATGKPKPTIKPDGTLKKPGVKVEWKF